MATAKPIASTPAIRSRPRRWRRVALVAAAVTIALLAWFWQPINSYALTGAAVGARIGCSCRFIEGRVLGDCRKDFEPGMQLVRLTEDAKAKSVTGSFPLLAHQTASFRQGEGCVLEKWSN
jgi:hypothetical protein